MHSLIVIELSVIGGPTRIASIPRSGKVSSFVLLLVI